MTQARKSALVAAAVMAGLTAASLAWLELSPLAFFAPDLIGHLVDYTRAMLPLDLESETLTKVVRGVIETLAISVAGTMLGAVGGLVFMPFAARRLLFDPVLGAEPGGLLRLGFAALHGGSRLVANVLRTTPYFVWAMLLWLMLGLGAMPAMLAIALHSTGVFARLFAGALDALETAPLDALRTTGARRYGLFLFGILPAVRAQLLSYTFYRWEVNLRESAVLGIIGTIGIGYHLKYATSTFDRHAAGTYILAIMILVLLVDWLSARFRRAFV